MQLIYASQKKAAEVSSHCVGVTWTSVRMSPNPESKRKAGMAGAGCSVVSSAVNLSILVAAWDKLLVCFSTAVLTPKMLFSVTIVKWAGIVIACSTYPKKLMGKAIPFWLQLKGVAEGYWLIDVKQHKHEILHWCYFSSDICFLFFWCSSIP